MNIEQQKALVLAKARLRLQQQPQSHPEFDASGIRGYNPETGLVERYGKAGSAAMGAADVAGMGFGDELAAGAGSLMTGEDYDAVLAEMRRNQARAYGDNPRSYVAGMVGGGLAGGAAMARGGASLAANAITRGAPLSRIALGSAADAALIGGLTGAGGGTDTASRLLGAGVGAVGGGALGALGSYAMAGTSAALSPIKAAILSRIQPEKYAGRAMSEGLRRSGRGVNDVTQALVDAQQAGQGMYNVADAMGHQGGRMLSTVARNPNEGRQRVVEALLQRQTGQGERLASFLGDAFEAPDTAAARTASLTAQRGATANANYAAARQGAGPVNLNNAIGEIDTLLGRDPILGETALSAGPLGSRLRALRDQLARDGEQLVDFDKVLNIKSDLYQQMQRNPQVANDMRGVYQALDQALEGASGSYRQANDTFRQQSRVIGAVEEGTAAASSRTRAADNIARFNAMTPEEQAAYRAGYSDPMIARVEAASSSPTTNKARILQSEKLNQEFPAMAAPGRGEELQSRIAREDQMFRTRNQALGGSKTADNLADAADLSRFDPSVMAKFLSGRPISAMVDSLGRLINEARGLQPGVLARVGDMLLETDPDRARIVLEAARKLSERQANQNALLNAVMAVGGGSTAGRQSMQ